MYGSILYNFWGSLIAFTISFIIMYQVSIFPSQVLIVSFSIAVLAFLIMFAIRYLIGYITYTPDDQLFDSLIDYNDSDVNGSDEQSNQSSANRDQQSVPTSSVEFQDEKPEEIANVVRTLINE